MKTWRERIEEAKARGGFTDEDRQRAWDCSRCAVGETLALDERDPKAWKTYMLFETLAGGLGAFFTRAVLDGRIALAEGYLDSIEDAAVQFKRCQASTYQQPSFLP